MEQLEICLPIVLFTDLYFQYPSHCGSYAIQYIRDLTTGYDNSQPDNRAVSRVKHLVSISIVQKKLRGA